MKGIVAFFKYNNAVPIAVSFALLGATGAYAATNPDKIISEAQEVISIDNTYIANKNLNKYTPTVKILSVREDEEFYFVSYELSTIELTDYVWKDVVQPKEMKIAKATLGNYRDLGEFVTKQLRELIANELTRLKETQIFEKRKITQKKVTTKYKGIVGGFLDAKTDTIDGYKPVVKIKEPEPEPQTFARPDPNAKVPAVPVPVVPQPQPEPELPQPDEQEQVIDETEEEVVNKPPTLTLLGESTIRVQKGGAYTDLGVVVEDDIDGEVPVVVFVNDVLVQSVQINTSATGTHTITYEATDTGGLIAQKKRTVEVYEATNTNSGGGGSSSGGSGTTASTTSPTTPPPSGSSTSSTTPSTTPPTQQTGTTPAPQTQTTPQTTPTTQQGTTSTSNTSTQTSSQPTNNEPVQQTPEPVTSMQTASSSGQ